MLRRPFALMALACAAAMAARAEAEEITVHDLAGLRREIAGAKPGAIILVAPGIYEGGVSARGIHGRADTPIAIRAADPKQPPTIRGGESGIHLSAASHVELANLVIEGATGNGINIDDGGKADEPSHHVALRGLVVRDVGPKGNRDGIKLSGLDDFRVEGCTVERWGDRGSGIDMVGCHRGDIVGCTFRHGDEAGDNGVQTKGGSAEIAVRRCRFDHAGQRAVNLGGSTGMPFFRPRPQGYEARAITVEDCTLLGSMAAVAFVGVDGATVRHNTIYGPKKWCLRVLQETKSEGFVPCRNGVFSDNLIAFRSGEMTVPINVGPGTAPDTFTLARNAWYCLDAPGRSRPKLEIPEADGVYGVDPRFRDAGAGDLRATGPAGARPEGSASGEGRP